MTDPDDQGSIYLNKDGKDVRFFIAGSKPDGTIGWEDVTAAAAGGREAQERAFAGRGSAYGKIAVENEVAKMIVITTDQSAHETIDRATKDAAAIAQEWMVPPGWQEGLSGAT